VQLPPLSAPTRPNLLSSVAAEPRATEGRWQTGIAYQPERAVGGDSIDPCGEVGAGDKTTTAGNAVVEWDPYIIWTGDRCTTLGVAPDEVEARAIRQLETQTSHLIEAILWTNIVDSADFGASHPNLALADAGLALPNAWDSVPPVTGFKDMVTALTTALGGARGMIHIEKRILPHIAFYGLAVQQGQRLVTTLGDHIVVPGTGYDGSDPEGNASSDNYSWIYGTSMVEVLISPIDVFTDLSESVNRDLNLIEFRAERMALAHWDNQAHIGLPLCLEDPAGQCSDLGS